MMPKGQGQRNGKVPPPRKNSYDTLKSKKANNLPKPKPKQNETSLSTKTKGVRFSTSVASTPLVQSARITPSQQVSQTTQSPSTGRVTRYQRKILSAQSKASCTVTTKTLPVDSKKTKPLNSRTADASNLSDHSKEIEHLRALNSELLQRLKSLEDDLKNTKAICELLSSSQNALPMQSAVPHSPAPIRTTTLTTVTSPVPDISYIVTQPVPTSSVRSSEIPTTSTNVTDPVPGPSNVPDSNAKPRLLVCGDSMVRGFGKILQALLPQHLVQCLTSPGASLSIVLKTIPSISADFTKTDIVFVLAGSNDIPNLSLKMLDTELQLLRNLCNSTNVVLSSIPYQYNMEKHNTNVFATNQNLLRLSSVYKYRYFECNFYLSRKMFTRHGLHLNEAGKEAYCERLSCALSVINLSSRSFLMPISLDPESNSNLNLSDQPQILDVTCPYDPQFDVSNPESRGNTVLDHIDDSSFFLTNLQIFPNL